MYEASEPGKQIIHENRPYAFGPYDPRWPELFQTFADEICTVFGDDMQTIEHVGSTSVPGMYAKPQIDILAIVASLDVVPRYYEPMQAYGYMPRGDYTNEGEEYFTKDDANGSRLASVHILPTGHRWASELLDLRDYLRTHPDEVTYYSNAKRAAYRQFPTDYTNYYITKDPVIKELKRRAAAWRHPAA